MNETESGSMKTTDGKAPDKQVSIRDDHGRFKPGRSGNAKGRPRKGSSISEALRTYLDQPGQEGVPRKEMLIAALFELAVDCDSIPAAKLLLDITRNFELEERIAALEQQVEKPSNKLGGR